MKKIFTVNEICDECDGTGLYIGFGEQDGAAVVCHRCGGTGCFKYNHTYEKFETKILSKEKIKRVFECNPGITIGSNDEVKLSDFGGMPYKDWLMGKSFPKGSEMRKYTCPAHWAQTTGIKKPNWDECEFGLFADCSSFKTKEKCWEKWDKEKENGNV